MANTSISTSKKESNIMSKAYRKFNGKTYTLYKSGTKKVVNDYIKSYGIPAKASYRIVKVGTENRLYMYFKK